MFPGLQSLIIEVDRSINEGGVMFTDLCNNNFPHQHLAVIDGQFHLAQMNDRLLISMCMPGRRRIW